MLKRFAKEKETLQANRWAIKQMSHLDIQAINTIKNVSMH